MPATATIKTRSLQAESLSAAMDRLINSILLAEGVVAKTANSFKVAQNLGTDMNVKVGSGTAYDRAVVLGDNAGQGVYVVEHANASQVLAIAAADATNPRIDIVILRVYDDPFDASARGYSDVEVVTGTPAASPSAPAVPSTAIKLAEVTVAAASTAVANANITDTRAEAKTSGAAPGGILGYAQVTADQGEITTQADLTGLSVTVTVAANRRIRITGSSTFVDVGSNAATALLRIKESTTQFNVAKVGLPASAGAAADERSVTVEAIITPSAGAHTYKLTAEGTTNIYAKAAADAPAFIQVEDLGPA